MNDDNLDVVKAALSTPPLHQRTRTWVIVAVLGILGLGWTHGTFDNFLWRVHLNYNDCAQNGFGAVFCGADLKRYQQQVGVNP